ncbi:hypothetical protein, partial [Salmonella sp. SAL4457]|uniref:hypothetical protein n=1 Tax=Salmonella sp. SAL4457 TaxID=3159912 RepID=UPI003978586B
GVEHDQIESNSYNTSPEYTSVSVDTVKLFLPHLFLFYSIIGLPFINKLILLVQLVEQRFKKTLGSGSSPLGSLPPS